MTVKELIRFLETIKDKNRKIFLASDEEWNTVFNDISIQKDSGSNNYVMFGLSGTEINLDD